MDEHAFIALPALVGFFFPLVFTPIWRKLNATSFHWSIHLGHCPAGIAMPVWERDKFDKQLDGEGMTVDEKRERISPAAAGQCNPEICTRSTIGTVMWDCCHWLPHSVRPLVKSKVSFWLCMNYTDWVYRGLNCPSSTADTYWANTRASCENGPRQPCIYNQCKVFSFILNHSSRVSKLELANISLTSILWNIYNCLFCNG